MALTFYVASNTLRDKDFRKFERDQDEWYITGRVYSDENFLEISADLLAQICPKVVPFLNERSGTVLTLNHKEGDIFVHTPEDINWSEHPSYASLPGKIDVSFYRWMLHNLKITLFGIILVAIISSMSLWLSIYLLALLPMLAIYLYIKWWKPIVWHYQNGNTCPGVVVEESPMLLAFYTNMTKGNGFYPALKLVSKLALDKNNKPLKIGDTLLGIALYTAYSDNPQTYWVNFDPLPINQVTKNKFTISKLERNIDPKDWEILKNEVSKLSGQYDLKKIRPIVMEGMSWKYKKSSSST